MPIPSFNSDGVLPPFIGRTGPPEWLSPYRTTAVEVVRILGTTATRQTILKGWFDHRAALRAMGFDRGFQWLVGSFVEDKEPKDLDTVGFLFRPPGIDDEKMLADLMQANGHVFDRAQVKATHSVDFMPVDLNGAPDALINDIGYWLNLFSHRRQDSLWKGFLQITLEDEAEDKAALALLDATRVEQKDGGMP